MTFLIALLTIIGLGVFEVVNSVENAVINAEVLVTMRPKARRWFLSWGLLFAVVIVRGLLPWVVVWASAPSLGFIGAFTATFRSDPIAASALLNSAPLLMLGGGIFLIMLFCNWLFMEEKNIGLPHERYFHRRTAGMLIVIAAGWSIALYLAAKGEVTLGVAASVGLVIFFITRVVKQRAELQEEDLLKGHSSDIRKVFYLEIIDAIFSTDSVFGAFAFTLSVPLILLGNGLGALVLRQLTVRNVRKINTYLYLKNGAMHAILFLGIIMMLESIGLEIPVWLAPLITLVTVGYYLRHSVRHRTFQS
jgi:hypothetical protein